jgi:chemotaxis protein MotB
LPLSRYRSRIGHASEETDMSEPTEIGDDDFGEMPSEVEQQPRRKSRAPWILLLLAVLGGAAGAAYLYWRLHQAQAGAAELAQRLQTMEAERAQLSLQVQTKDEELAKLQGTYNELEAKMKDEIAQGDVRLSQSGGRIKVDLVDKIIFDIGEASVTERGGEVLSRVGAVLANVKDKKIQVSGHTDDLPIHERLRDRYPTNWELAATRATNVVRYLEEKAHVPGKLLVAAAYGPWEPISSNRTDAGRMRNRRIEIVLAPALAPAPTDDPALVPAAAPAKAAPAKASRAKAAPKKKARRR